MTDSALMALTEDELDVLVSIAIHRAEVLAEIGSPSAKEAWREVKTYEEQLAAITRVDDIPGGVARVGAVTAALAAGERQEASRLASRFLAEAGLPSERQQAIGQAFREDHDRLALRFPALAKSGRLAELDEWRSLVARGPRVFPVAA